PPGAEGEALARTRGSLARQSVPAAAVREVGLVPGDLADASGTHIAFLVAGDRLAPNACAELAHALKEQPDATIVYTDEDEWPAGGERQAPQLKPDWDPELARACGYTGFLACFRRDLLAALQPGLAVGDLCYTLGLAATARAETLAQHVPLVLYHADP